MEPEILVSCSQETATGAYSEPNESISQLPPYFSDFPACKVAGA